MLGHNVAMKIIFEYLISLVFWYSYNDFANSPNLLLAAYTENSRRTRLVGVAPCKLADSNRHVDLIIHAQPLING